MVHLVGNAHLDPAWMWRMDEGLEAFAATCRSALDRIDEFPDFIFTCSSAAHYAFVEDTDPKLFAQIQQAVRNDRWSIVGGWWVEPDCNLPSGESFVRQALLGQRYFLSRFGKIVTVGYCVDSFGHNANIPQLLRKAGMDSYVFMRPDNTEKPLEAALFAWEAPSGDKVKAYRLPLHYSNHQLSVGEKLRLLPESQHYSADQPWMIFYGVGNHGGGPTIAQLKEIDRLRIKRNDLVLSDPSKFFAGVDIDSLPVIKGEMQHHAIGCYSAHSEIKRLNRRAENALTQAESTAVLAYLVGVEPAPLNFEQAWKNVCFNQFHDIVGGVAIKEACDEAITMYQEALSIAERATRTNVQRIASRIDTSAHIENLIVFNPCAFDREELIEFELWHPEASERGEILNSVTLMDREGKEIGTQKAEPSGKIGEDRVRFVAQVFVLALGWTVLGIKRNVATALGEKLASENKNPLTATVFEDGSDTWSHGVLAFTHNPREMEEQSRVGIEDGPLRKITRVQSSHGASRLEQDICTNAFQTFDEHRIFLDWREENSIVKLRIPHGCNKPVALSEISYSSIERPIGNEEWPGQTWVAVSDEESGNGVAIVTDSKYSYSIDDTYISILAARSPLYAHHLPPHSITNSERLRYQDQGEQNFRVLVAPFECDWRSINLPRLAEQLHKPLIVHHESRHGGDLPRTHSAFSYSGDGLRIGAIKHAEDGNGIIVRVVEERGEDVTGVFSIPALRADWSASFLPFDIKSFLVADGNIVEVDFIERPL